jgi:integrase
MAHVEKRGERKYRARHRGPDGKERSQTFTTERAAKRFLTTVEHSKLAGSYVDPKRGKLTVGEWGKGWLAGRVDLKPKTAAGYASLWTTQIMPTWENVPLVAVTNADVAEWVAAMHKKGLSASRVRQAAHLFGAMLTAAVADRRLAASPAVGVKLPRMPRTEDRYLTHDELAMLADACGSYRTLVRVLGYCGLRWGEAAALRVGRVDMLRGRLEVVEAMSEVDGKAVFGTPKTHQRRSVPLPAFLRPELAQLLEGKNRGDFVFAAPRGGVLRVGNFRRTTWNAACIAVGLAETVKDEHGQKHYRGLTPHDLRHAAASFAIAAGASVKGVQSMLGHRSATQTLDRYAALFGDELDAVAERIDVAAQEAHNSRPNRGLAVVTLPTDKAV